MSFGNDAWRVLEVHYGQGWEPFITIRPAGTCILYEGQASEVFCNIMLYLGKVLP